MSGSAEKQRSVTAASFVKPAVLAVYSGLVVAGLFDDFDKFGILQYSLTALLIILILFEVVELSEVRDFEPARVFTLGLWLAIAVRIAVQLTGDAHSPLHPLSYLFFAVMVSVLGAGYGAVLWLVFIGLEAGWALVSGGPEVEIAAIAGHAAYSALFGLVVGGFVHTERRSRQKAERVLHQLKKDLSELQKDDTVLKMAGLSDGGRQKESLRSLFALDKALAQALECGSSIMDADTVALYWRNDDDDYYHLREIVTRREAQRAEEVVSPGVGLLGRLTQTRIPVRASGKSARDALPYLSGAGSDIQALAVPVEDGEEVPGILVADRSGGREFSTHDEKILSVLANQVGEIQENAALMRKTESEAAQFKSLAQLSHRLSQTLRLDEILESVVRTSKAITGHDGVVIVLSLDNGSGTNVEVALTGGELDPALQGKPVSDRESLVMYAMKSDKPVSMPDLSERERRTTVLGAKLDPPGMKSLLIQPLSISGENAGAMVFFARDRDAFSRYAKRAAGILADIAAVSIHNANLYSEMEKKAVTDGLTGLHNHRWFQEQLDTEIERAGRLGNKVVVVIADIDHFKKVNDSYGHPAGDEVLKAVASVFKDTVRKVDSAARYGGEEFVLILMGAERKGALELTERIRKRIAKLVFNADGTEFRITLSMGVAIYPDDAREKSELVEYADQALYRAKQTGRDRTVFYSQIAPKNE